MRRLHVLPLAIVVLIAAPSAAAAHAELVSSQPADGATLTRAPREVVLTFDDELDPDRSQFVVTDASGKRVGSGELDLAVADRNVLRGTVAIADPGTYTVSYSVAGLDGHVVTGSFDFAFESAAAQPDTALLARGGTSLVTLLGLALLIAAAAAIPSATRSGLREARR